MDDGGELEEDGCRFPLAGRVPVPGPELVRAPTAGNSDRRGGGGPRFSVCELCHGPARPGCSVCWSCQTVLRRLDGRSWPVAPLCLLARPSAVHRALVAYKAAPSRGTRLAAGAALASWLAEHLERHLHCLAGSSSSASWLLVPVPSSTGGRPSWGGIHPLADVVAAAARRAGGPVAARASLVAGERPPRRLAPAVNGFRVAPGEAGYLAGAQVLVVDDLFVSGARAASAAVALEAAGAQVRAILPFARFVRPEHNRATASFWQAATRVRPSGLCPACRGRVSTLACRRSTLRVA